MPWAAYKHTKQPSSFNAHRVTRDATALLNTTPSVGVHFGDSLRKRDFISETSLFFHVKMLLKCLIMVFIMQWSVPLTTHPYQWSRHWRKSCRIHSPKIAPELLATDIGQWLATCPHQGSGIGNLNISGVFQRIIAKFANISNEQYTMLYIFSILL